MNNNKNKYNIPRREKYGKHISGKKKFGLGDLGAEFGVGVYIISINFRKLSFFLLDKGSIDLSFIFTEPPSVLS